MTILQLQLGYKVVLQQLPAPGVCGVYGTPGVIGLNATGDGV